MQTKTFLRQRSWRFYRNWLTAAIAWAVIVVIVFQVFHDPIHLIWGIPLGYFSYLVWKAYRYAHPPVQLRMSRLTPKKAGMDAEIVEFKSRDGLNLFGWFVPGKKKAAVILVHGFGSRGISMIYHASAFLDHGYSVLMFDLRAHGSSEGDTCTLSSTEVNDLLGAVDFLKSRTDVNPDRIGVFGVSMGGSVAIQGAAECEDIRVVAVEGIGPSTLEDLENMPVTLRRRVTYPINWMMQKLDFWMNGAPSPKGMVESIRRIAPRPLLIIAAGKTREPDFAKLFSEHAGYPIETWVEPRAKHTGVYFIDPQAYQQRLAVLFDPVLSDPFETNRKQESNDDVNA